MKVSWLRRQLDKFHGCDDFTNCEEGRWFVRYPDGRRSTTMYHHAAKNYAAVIKGTVHHVSEVDDEN